MKNKPTYFKKLKRVSISALVVLFFSIATFAQGLKVAVAANLQGVIKDLQKDFASRTGINIEPIVGSSGNLSAQIRNGAPYDVFLSADMSFPDALYKEGFSLKEPVVYANGSLIICSKQNRTFDDWEKLMVSDQVKKIAIANPVIAPYGKAAEESLKVKGILDNIKTKIVYGESIAQVNTYIATGVVDIGFTTQSFIKDNEGKTTLYWKQIDPKLYSPIQQGAIILKQSKNSGDALKFYEYLLSAPAKTILKEYGYGV